MPDGTPWPRISIVTPSFNQAQFLEETIRSVLLQGYPDLEYMIVDGGSTDSSVETIRKYEPWLAYWVSEKDRGQSHAINKGFARASGSLLAWLNSDDYYEPGCFATAAAFLTARSHVDLVYGGCNIVDQRGCLRETIMAQEVSLERLLLTRGGIFQAATFIRRTVLAKVGFVNEALHYVMDFEYWLRILDRCQAVPLPAVLANYRKVPGTKSVSRPDLSVAEILETLPRFLADPSCVQCAGLPAQRIMAHAWWDGGVMNCFMENWEAGRDMLRRAIALYDLAHHDLDMLVEPVAGNILGQTADGRSGIAERFIRFVRIMPLSVAARLYVARKSYSTAAMAQVFHCVDQHNLGAARCHLAVGVMLAPSWLRNLGVWSIACEAFLGASVTARFRRIGRKLLRPQSEARHAA
jgi:hypothetical protein